MATLVWNCSHIPPSVTRQQQPDPEQSEPSVWILSLVTHKKGCQGNNLKMQSWQFHSSSIHPISMSITRQVDGHGMRRVDVTKMV